MIYISISLNYHIYKTFLLPKAANASIFLAADTMIFRCECKDEELQLTKK